MSERNPISRSSWQLLHTLEVIAPLQHALGAHYVVLIAAMYTDLFSGKKLRDPDQLL